jgi:3-methyladenine DNA glycosylase AlkD
MINELKKELQSKANPEKAKVYQWFFKTGKGEYGEGDIFLGIIMSEQRKTTKKFKELSLENIQKLLNSKIHEHRIVALVILIEQFQKSKDENERKKLFEFYMNNYDNINNWDLVDISAHKIAGPYLLDKDKSISY